MNAVVHSAELERVVLPPQPLHLAIGMFDGVHLGHRSVIESAVHSARRSGGQAGVLTFWPHPSELINPAKATRLMLTPAMKRRLLAGLGVDFIIEQPFTADFAQKTAEEFVPWLQRCLPQVKAVYVGENWRFGRNRSGDVPLLVRAGQATGLEIFSAPRLNHNGAPISSSRIRTLLESGEVAQANALLGYAYFAEGVVARGRQLGRTLDVPTLNVPWAPALRPAYGVYAAEIEMGEGRVLPAVANYGVRPTVEATDQPTLEVHALVATTLTYGDAITVRWLDFLRPERKFDGVEALRAQIAVDVAQARKFFRIK